VNVRTHRAKVVTGIAAACLALSSIGPSFAQSAPVLGSWLAGPDGKGSSTIVGRIESPRPRATVNSGANVLVSGWAADTTATGWAGIDGVEVWNGARDKSGSTKVATGAAGLARSDIGEALGRTFTNSGFTAIIPSSALQHLIGTDTLFVYLHTPDKGTWYRNVTVNVVSTAGVNLATGATLAFPNDPIVVITKPQDGTAITQRQKTNKFSFTGFALDRNPITNTDIQLTGPGQTGNARSGGAGAYHGTESNGAGIYGISAYFDNPPAKGDPSIFGNFGLTSLTNATPNLCTSACLYANIPVANGASNSWVTREYGGQFDFSGWSIAINPLTLSPGTHTLYVTATSSVTGSLNQNNQFVGKQTTASVTFQVLDLNHLKIQP
jgi:hypothetical protein